MNIQHKKLLELQTESIPHTINSIKVPSIYHCAGTNKLIGQYYGQAIFENIGINDEHAERIISELSILLRSYIVLDDFIKDNDINENDAAPLTCWIENIKEHSLELISSLSSQGREIWEACKSIYDNAYNNFNQLNIYESIIHKCMLIYIPFSLDIVSSKNNSNKTYSFMKDYLFALQMLDDFKDMEEDLIAPKNHNIYLTGLSDRNHMLSIIERKHIIAPSILKFIKNNFQIISQSINSKIILKFLNENIAWLNKNISTMESFNKIYEIEGSFEDFNFIKFYQFFMDYEIDNICLKFEKNNHIKAENMHTVENI